MRWIVTGFALAAVALAGVDVARACGGCCKGSCPSCPQSGSPSGPARPAAPAACPSCPQPEATSGAYRYPASGAGSYAGPVTASPAGDGRNRPVGSPPPPAPVVSYSTSYPAAPRTVQTTSRYERPAR